MAIEEINRLKPDVVFLDIEIPELDGFKVAEETKDINYQLVFVSAYDKYALDAFGTKAIDYLLKPVRPELLEKCINKILQQEAIVLATLDIKKAPQESLFLSDGKTSRVINKHDIAYIEGIGRYRRVHLSREGEEQHRIKTIISDTTLEDFESQLSNDGFQRVHRSYLINTAKVVSIRKDNRRYVATLADQDEPIPVSRSKYPRLSAVFEGND